MEASRELAYIIRNVEKEKLKYGISVLKDVRKKVADKATIFVIENEIEKLETHLDAVIADLEDDEN
jgi:hypothetical protein